MTYSEGRLKVYNHILQIYFAYRQPLASYLTSILAEIFLLHAGENCAGFRRK